MDSIKVILNRPFPREIIKERQGQRGKKLNYVETVYYIERLNEAFGVMWNWKVTDFKIMDKEVYCKGQLTYTIEGKEYSKEAFGGKDITVIDVYDKTTRKIIGQKNLSIADDLKSAGSDALKKACSLLGIGLHLYKK